MKRGDRFVFIPHDKEIGARVLTLAGRSTGDRQVLHPLTS